MKRRTIYISIFIVLFILLFTIVSPYLNNLVTSNTITEKTSRFLFMAISYSISIPLAIIVYIEGKHLNSIKVMAILIVVTRIGDLVTYYVYPDRTAEGNFISIMGAALAILFSIVLFKVVLFTKRVALFFLFSGLITFVRFPYYVDIFHYVYKFLYGTVVASNYYFDTVMYFYYAVFLFQILALDSIVLDNKRCYRYS